jgi:hypothetical protein
MWPKLLITALAILLTGCNNDGDPIHIVVPPGFEGVIQIVVDGKDGGGYQHLNGQHRYTIPADGVLHVRSSEPFEKWHKLSASDLAGKTIYWIEPAAPTPQDPIIREFGTSITNNGPPIMWFAVGSPEFVARVEKWSYNRSGPPPSPATRPAT